MYRTCLFCHSDLGSNEELESFPVGRRLAFDAAKGRLWVVCRKCARWNLTPLEERWEAIEECERAFSATRLRVATDNVGLARLRSGVELVRIGQPQRPEFAAWRYGDQFGRRRRRHIIYGTGIIAVGVGAFVTGPVLGLAIGSAVSALNSAGILANLIQQNRVRARVHVPGKDRPAVVRQSQLGNISIVTQDERWHLRMRYDRGLIVDRGMDREVIIEGDAAVRAAATILAVTNHAGANMRRVREAVDIASGTTDPSRLFLQAAQAVPKARTAAAWAASRAAAQTDRRETPLTRIPGSMLLALEMASNEDIERRALEGELAMLEEAWRQAEEIARIADNLALPEGAARDFDKLAADRHRSERDGVSQ